MTDDDLELQKIRERKAEQLRQLINEKEEWPGEVVHVNDGDLQETIDSYGSVLVDFWAPWCGPCKMIAPILEKLAPEYRGKLVIAKLNVDQNRASASRFHVQGIPTMILFKNGTPVERITGALPRASLKEVIDKHLHS